MNELTDKEKEFLIMLFKTACTMLDCLNGSVEMSCCNHFNRNDLFNLSEKLGVEYYWY